MSISFQSRDLSLDEFKQDLINADRSSVYYPLNAIDIAMQPKVINGLLPWKTQIHWKTSFLFFPTPCLLVLAYKLDFEDFIQHNAHCFQTTFSTCIEFLSFQSNYSVPTMIKKSLQLTTLWMSWSASQKNRSQWRLQTTC